MPKFIHNFLGHDTASKSREQHSLQLAPRLRHFCAGITFKGRVGFVMREIWKPIVGYESYYDVSNTGRVRTALGAKNHSWHFHAGKILKQHLICRYFRVALCGPIKKFRTVHSLVLTAFKGPRPPGHVSRHLDGNAFNNASRNLAWGTPKQNMHDKQRHGTQTRGVTHGPSKVTESDVIAIRKLKKSGLTLDEIAKRFPISRATIWTIVKRMTWKHI